MYKIINHKCLRQQRQHDTQDFGSPLSTPTLLMLAQKSVVVQEQPQQKWNEKAQVQE